jgi:hypothetical protein
MVDFPKMGHLHGKFSKNGSFSWQFTKKILFAWEILTYGSISVALIIKIPMLLRNFFFHVLETITQPVLGKFLIKVKISMAISNSVLAEYSLLNLYFIY